MLPGGSVPDAPADPADDRAYWVDVLTRISRPVIENLAEGRLRASMPVETRPGREEERRRLSHLEAFGRTMAGLAPWIALPDDSTSESELRAWFRERSQAAMAHAVDPASPDFMNFTYERQPLVDAAFLAHAIIRAPQVLWHDLPAKTQDQLADALIATRAIVPHYNNWILFSAMVEAALLAVGRQADLVRIDLAVRQTNEWYLGDGHFGDGADFHWDYYNSYVIQPFMLDVLRTSVAHMPSRGFYEEALATQIRRSQRYGAIQERLVAPDGTFPPIGRSLAYRFGAFQLLAQLALQEILPSALPDAQVRSALTAVIRRVMDAGDTFDENGWLRIGLYGSQPSIGEGYISTGSLYLATTGLLPLGLPPTHPFWTDASLPWTSVRVWSGEDVAADHAL